MKIRERDVIFWHLIDEKGLTEEAISEQLKLKVEYLHNVRVGRKPITDRMRYLISMTWFPLNQYFVKGKLPELPEHKIVFLKIEELCGDDIKAIAAKIGADPTYLGSIRSGRNKMTDALRFRLIDAYRGLLTFFNPHHTYVPLEGTFEPDDPLRVKVFNVLDKKGLTDRELAKRLGCQPTHLSLVRNGHRQIGPGMKFRMIREWPELVALLLPPLS